MIKIRDKIANTLAGLAVRLRTGNGAATQIPAPPPSEPLPYRAFTNRFDRIATAEDVLNWLKVPKGAENAEGSFLDSAPDLRAAGLARALAFQKRWATGHGLGLKPLVTILIDHSGSMRGARAMAAALAADALGAAFEASGIAFDVLGYTTSSWRGGLSMKAWRDAGSPPYPGRVCDLLHIVYRDALKHGSQSTRWRHDLRLLLQDAALKENIDGEALLWAQQRANTFSPSCWVCFVISDGAPVDDTTLILSEPDILTDHLRLVARGIIDSGGRIGGIGLEFDTAEFYPVSRSVKEFADAPVAAFDIVETLIWPETGENEQASPGSTLLD